MDRQYRYFALNLDSLRVIGGWAADCAELALSVYETHPDSDSRPRAAIEGIRGFAGGGKRTARLRPLLWKRMPPRTACFGVVARKAGSQLNGALSGRRISPGTIR